MVWFQGEGRSGGDLVTIRLQNVTLLNHKAFAYIADLAQQEEPPQVCVLLECHLRGVELNKARRQIKTLGWRSFATPALPGHPQHVPDEAGQDIPRIFHNSGGGDNSLSSLLNGLGT